MQTALPGVRDASCTEAPSTAPLLSSCLWWAPSASHSALEHSFAPSSPFCPNPTPPLLVDGFSTLFYQENRSYWHEPRLGTSFPLLHLLSRPPIHVNHSRPFFSETWSPSSYSRQVPQLVAWTLASSHLCSLTIPVLSCVSFPHSPQRGSVSPARRCISVFAILTKLSSGNK